MGTIATDFNSIFLHIYFSFLSKIYTFADDFTAITLAIMPIEKKSAKISNSPNNSSYEY